MDSKKLIEQLEGWNEQHLSLEVYREQAEAALKEREGMSEYIDKKALLDEICRDNCERSYDGTCHNCRMTETIADFPAADVAPVVHGRWDEHGKCIVCGGHAPFWCMASTYYTSQYCPECGAKMDGDQDG